MARVVEPALRCENVRHGNRDLVPIAQEVGKSGKRVLYLNTGDPIQFDFRAPAHLWDAINSRRKECEAYTNAIGSDGAREAVAGYARRMGAESVGKDDVINFVGGSEAIIVMLQALLNRGENILTPAPGYSVYTGELAFLECPVNEYLLYEESGWAADIESLRSGISQKTKAIVVVNPNNPAGSVLSRKNLCEIINVAGEHSLPVIADETYDKILYDGAEFVSAASVAGDVPVVSLGGISKNFLAPGFRGAWIYRQDTGGVLENYFDAVKKLCRLRLTNSGVAQVAIEAALSGPEGHIKEAVSRLQKRRDLAYKRLNEISGVTCTKTKGAFYAFPRLGFPLESDMGFVMGLLKETGVLVTHGSAFGQKPGTKHFRLVFLPQESVLEDALSKIEGFIKAHHSG